MVSKVLVKSDGSFYMLEDHVNLAFVFVGLVEGNDVGMGS